MNRYLILIDAVFILLYIFVAGLLYYLGVLPRTIRVLDLILLGLASARLTDIISTDEVMKWLREPFIQMEHEKVAGREVEVRMGRGRGFRRVFGELLSCPWCVGVWVAAGLSYAYFLFPQPVWLFILILAVAEIGSFLQTLSTIMVRFEKYLKGLGVPEEGI
ncbi:MAG TPA: DUF1360 domain-containing protein [Armatimonadota bacterium]|jgi:hypothetical protein|nr:DUF1360 domain-containing protein [Armatimonadota bacterium]HOM71716.1 DUF1360 domain-containing protein [Armatimonadota bacterium]HOP79057.1 DUF1360 domain-containing protein [Armatimonadota bacterium]HPP73702.1 DUF1360 domain-containing protein [Armatimonadota bacterium]